MFPCIMGCQGKVDVEFQNEVKTLIHIITENRIQVSKIPFVPVFSGVHLGLVVQLHAEGREGGSVHLRTDHSSSGSRQCSCCSVSCQSSHEVHGNDATSEILSKFFKLLIQYKSENRTQKHP